MFRPSRRQGSHPLVFWQVGLFFLAAGIWIGGLLSDRTELTPISIGILVLAMILGLIGRRLRDR